MEMTTAIRERITQKIRMRIKDYQEVFLERFVEAYWEGFQEGFMKGVRDSLLCQMEGRPGPVPNSLRRRVEGIQDPEELQRIAERLLAAVSPDAFGL
jgi:hypothetical protein